MVEKKHNKDKKLHNSDEKLHDSSIHSVGVSSFNISLSTVTLLYLCSREALIRVISLPAASAKSCSSDPVFALSSALERL
jgi:hypothetical protein